MSLEPVEMLPAAMAIGLIWSALFVSLAVQLFPAAVSLPLNVIWAMSE